MLAENASIGKAAGAAAVFSDGRARLVNFAVKKGSNTNQYSKHNQDIICSILYSIPITINE